MMPLFLRTSRVVFHKSRRFSAKVSKDVPEHENKLKMSGYQIHGYGGPEELQFSDNIRIPQIKDSSTVLVKVKAAGVNPIDLLISNGYGSKMLNALRCDSSGIEFPLTLGREFSGVVVQKGMGVDSSLQIGDEVWGVVQPHCNGSHAEYVAVPHFCVARKPKLLSHTDAAGVLYAGLTAWSGLFFSAMFGGVTGAICPNQTKKHGQGMKVLVLGGSGGVGSLAIQMLKAENATVFATCSEDAGPMVKNLGADGVFNYSNPEDMAQMERCGPFDIILDCAGQGTDFAHKINTSFNHYVTFSSPLMRNTDSDGIVLGMVKNAFNIIDNNAKSLINKKGMIKWGFFAPAPQGIEYFGRLVDNRKLLPIVDTVFPFSQTKEAFDKVRCGHLRGKVVIDFEKITACD